MKKAPSPPLLPRVLLAVACAAAPLLPSVAEAGVNVGDKAAKFTFTDIRFSPRSLDDFGMRKVFVLVFTSAGCPLAQRYLPRLKELAAEFDAKGVQFLAVNSGTGESVMDMAWQAMESAVEFPFVKDFDGQCARALGAARTPEAVVLDAERHIRYRGRIDDQFRLGGAKPAAGRSDLHEAITDVLAGGNVRVEETPVDGCAISLPALPAKTRALTYARDIAPLMNKHCVECHRPETAAPFVLTSYDKVAAKAAPIAEVVEQRRMPPWFAHPAHGKFVNQRGLSAEERETVIQWARRERAPGDPAQVPPAPVFPGTKWSIGEPDLVITAAAEENCRPQATFPIVM